MAGITFDSQLCRSKCQKPMSLPIRWQFSYEVLCRTGGHRYHAHSSAKAKQEAITAATITSATSTYCHHHHHHHHHHHQQTCPPVAWEIKHIPPVAQCITIIERTTTDDTARLPRNSLTSPPSLKHIHLKMSQT